MEPHLTPFQHKQKKYAKPWTPPASQAESKSEPVKDEEDKS